MKITLKLRFFLFACGSLLGISSASAADGTWTLNNNGNWSATGNWSGGTVAEGADSTAFLGNVITSGRTITLDTARTIGNITAQDTTHDYTISGANILTFDVTSGTPTVSVVANRTLTFNSTTLAGNDGLLLSGGRVSIRTAVVSHTGGTTVDAEAVLTANNLGTGNWRLNNGVLSDYYRSTTVFGTSGGLGTGNGQVQIYGNSGFGGGNGNSNWRIGAQNSVLKWGTVGEGATGFFNPTVLKFFSAFDNMGPTTFGQVTLQNGIDLNSGSRTIDVLQASGPNAIHSSVAKIDAGITDTGSGGSLTKTGGGNLLIAGTSNYTGGTTINAGSVRFDRIAAMPSSGNVQVNDGAILGVRVGGTGNWSGGASGVGTLGGLIAGFGGAGTSTVSYSGNVGLLLDVTTNTSSSATITNAGATSLALYKMGGSSLTLSGNNSYTGGTFLQQGTLIADSANALGTAGDITFRGGTLQYTANSAANDYGSRIKNSTSTLTLDTNSQNVTLSGLADGNTGGLTKNGAGKLTFTGTNTYSGATNLNAGTIEVYDGTLSTSGGAVSMVSNTTISVLGGIGVTSTWNLGGQQLGTPNNSYSNLQISINGNGVAGSALMTNVGILVWGRTTNNSTILLTDGGQMNVSGEIRIGNPYYNENGGANVTIGGGTATSTFSGDGGDDFYIGYGERTGSKNNVVTVSTGGVLTNLRDMYVGHVNNTQNNDNPTTNNELLVSGTGIASMRQLSVGFADVDTRDALANVVSVSSGGTLSTTGVAYVGRADNPTSTSNSNTLTVTGAGSSWNAGNQNVLVGFTNNLSAASNNNILTIGAGASVTNVNTLTVGSGSGTETGNQLVVNGSLSATTVTVNAGNSLSGSGTINAAVTVNGAYSPGQSPGTMTFQDTLTLAASSSTTIEVDGTNGAGAIGGHDFTNLTGVGAAGVLAYGGTMTIDIGVIFGAGTYSWNLFDFASETSGFTGIILADQYSGSLTDGGGGVWGLVDGGDTWQFTESTGVLGLTVIPEPNMAALLGALGTVLLLRRRRNGSVGDAISRPTRRDDP